MSIIFSHGRYFLGFVATDLRYLHCKRQAISQMYVGIHTKSHFPPILDKIEI